MITMTPASRMAEVNDQPSSRLNTSAIAYMLMPALRITNSAKVIALKPRVGSL